MEKITVQEFIARIRKSEAARSLIPMEMVSGLPIVSMRRGKLCLTIPYYRVTVQPEDKTLIYPLAHTITALWPSGRIIDYKDLGFLPALKRLDFAKPIGTFRHEAIKHLTKQEYAVLKKQVLSLYDGYLQSVSEGKPFAGHEALKDLLNMIMEPCQKPMYMLLGKNFFQSLIEL